MTLDLLLNLIQVIRLCSLAEIEVDPQEELIQRLLDFYFKSKNFGNIPENEVELLMTRAANVIGLGYASGLQGYFANIKRLFVFMLLENGEEMISTAIKTLKEDDVLKLKEQIMKKYTIEKLSNDHETRNNIFTILTAVIKSRYSSAMEGMGDYIYDLFTEMDCLSSNSMNFATAYLNVCF